MSYNFQPLQDVMNNWAANDTTRYNFHEPKPNNIIFMQGQTEMLKVADDGFYVRGVKVPVDDQEATTVYKAFKEFLVWSRLHRD
jgi:hypothetical protein